MAKAVQAKLLLTGRSQFPPRDEWEKWLATRGERDATSIKIRKLLDIEALGAEVLVVSADVINPEQMQAAITQSRERFGSINGVIHAAGVPGGGALARKTRERAESILEPKVKGTVVLDAIFKDVRLDFFVLCSSINSMMGVFGQIDYCEANAFMDAFAQYKSAKDGTLTVAINWDGWQKVGMAAEAAKQRAETMSITHDHNLGLLPTEGIEVFDRILGSGLPQVLVSTRDLLSRLEQDNMSTFLSSLKETEQEHLPKQVHPRPQLSNAYVAPRNELERQIAESWEKLLVIEHVGIYDDLFDLGGDSLLAVQLIAGLKENLQMGLSVNSLLDNPTIAGLVELIAPTSSSSASDKPPTEFPSSLVKIQVGSNNKQPLFLVHPVGGQVYFYRDLVSCLESERPVYGFQSLDLDEKTELLTKVEEMAAKYIKAMRVIQSNGAYFIGSASFGGTIAFEMAQQLHAEGEKVAVLAMIDTPGSGQMGVKLEDETAIATYILDSLFELDKKFLSLNSIRQQGNAEEQVIYALEQAKIANLVPNDFQIPTTRQIIRVFKANMEAMWNYTPRIYPGKIIFFRAQDRREKYDPVHPEYAWMELAASGIEIHPVSGNHITMNALPHVQIIAEKLKVCLEQNN